MYNHKAIKITSMNKQLAPALLISLLVTACGETASNPGASKAATAKAKGGTASGRQFKIEQSELGDTFTLTIDSSGKWIDTPGARTKKREISNERRELIESGKSPEESKDLMISSDLYNTLSNLNSYKTTFEFTKQGEQPRGFTSVIVCLDKDTNQKIDSLFSKYGFTRFHSVDKDFTPQMYSSMDPMARHLQDMLGNTQIDYTNPRNWDYKYVINNYNNLKHDMCSSLLSGKEKG